MGLKDENLTLMRKYGIKAQKKYGQNFLINEEVLDKILKSADIKNEDLVIEIGPGLGNLTKRLCDKAGEVVAIEIDKEMANILTQEYENLHNLHIVNMDVMKCNLSEIINEYPNLTVKVVANLPYYITTPIIMKLLEEEYDIKLIEVMVQKEVANRLCAKPGTSDFGAITLAINFYTNIDYIVTVPAKDFLPAPNVDSAVTRMEIVKNKIEVEDKNLLFSIIKASFLMKRKTLLNSLGSAKILGIDKASLGNILEKLNIPQNVRAENLSIEDFNRLTSEYIKISKDKGIK
ncbi:MAG: 16S rRNA (adenine(1518)-N(6)/adenine(1519)-N(6))-dimethyltransferase RsmA [Clostridia bacterium]|nr:16S rRNA (adenine(1518)-N(6)/adenine(1519)-N(6))-dimethyltransferase RsmA [Clostridia bacterium]